jgi:hypothetical protein
MIENAICYVHNTLPVAKHGIVLIPDGSRGKP